jgi:hypothetical protein
MFRHFHPYLPTHQLWQQSITKGSEGADLVIIYCLEHDYRINGLMDFWILFSIQTFLI